VIERAAARFVRGFAQLRSTLAQIDYRGLALRARTDLHPRAIAQAWSRMVAENRARRSVQRRANAKRWDMPRGIGSALAVLILVSFWSTGFYFGGHYDDFARQNGTLKDIAARKLGLGIASVAVTGNKELSTEEVFAAAAMPATSSLPFLDIASVQERLTKVPLIAGASIKKFYPNRLLIEITERSPFALWQQEGQVHVIAADGTAIDVLRDDRFVNLPHVVGPGANKRAKEYVAILLEVPEMAEQVRAGTLVGERRWNLKLKNGVDVKLPEDEPARALARLAENDRETRLLAKDILSVDMRFPDRIVVRLSEESAQARAEMLERKIEKLKRRG
jgi:cell division protein FtsQ